MHCPACGHDGPHFVAGNRCECRCCPRCTVIRGARLRKRLSTHLEAWQGLRWTHATYTTWPADYARRSHVAFAALAPTQGALQSLTCTLATMGSIEPGPHGAAHAHILVVHEGYESTWLLAQGYQPWKDAHGGYIRAATEPIEEQKGAPADVLTRYLLEHATKLSRTDPEIAAEMLSCDRGKRRWRVSGAWYGAPSPPRGGRCRQPDCGADLVVIEDSLLGTLLEPGLDGLPIPAQSAWDR